MKAPRAKLHLLDVDEPLLAFSNLECRCGIVLHFAIPKFMESQDMPHDAKPSSRPDLLGLCDDCRILEPQNADDKRIYCYGLVEAQESLHVEFELEEAVA